MTLELWSFHAGLGGSELRGMSVEALDGNVGKVKEVVDQLGGAHLVVDTGPWIFGKTVVVPAGLVTAVERDEGRVRIACSQDDVKNAPEPEPDAGDAAVRQSLTAHYGQARRPDDRAEPESGITPIPDATSTPRQAAGTAVPPPIATPRTDTELTPAAQGRDETAALGSSDEGEEAPISRPSAAISPTQPAERPAESDRPHADITPAPAPAPPGAPSGPAGGGEHGPGPAGPQAGEQDTSSDDAQAASGPAPQASTSVGHEDAARQDEDRPTRRFARSSGEETSRSEGTPKSADHSPGGERTSSAQPPIARYDALTAAEVNARLRNLSQRELAALERYEQRHQGRQTVLSRIESLREDEPWRGYDDATVPEITRRLADADEEKAKAVRDYERRHRDRKGVMEAARRIAASA